MKFLTKFIYHFCVVLALYSFIDINAVLPPNKHSKFEEDLFIWSKPMAEVFHLINTKSYYPIDVEDSIIKAMNALAQNQDDYSLFLSQKGSDKLIKFISGNFFGIGIRLAPKKPEDDFLMILDVIPGKPAHKKGLEKFDKIVAIDGTPVGPLPIEEAIDKLKSDKRYSKVSLDIVREKKGAFAIKVERDLIEEEHIVSYYLPEQNIIYCAISLFTQTVSQQLEKALTKSLSKNPKGLVLDLRDNTGGALHAAVECAGLFLKKDSLVVSTKDRNQKVIETLHTKRNPLIKNDLIIIILVNEYTASAAEILAKALKAHSEQSSKTKAISPYVYIVGATTFGKASVQEVIPVSNSCMLKLTIALYYLPDNSCIQSVGITPDFLVEQKYPPTPEMKLLTKIYGKERGKNKSVTEQPKNKDQELKDWKNQKEETLKNDYQVQSALNIVSLLDLGLSCNPQKLNTHENALKWLHSKFVTPTNIELEELKG